MVHTLKLTLSQGRGVASDDNQLCLAGSEGLKRGLVSESNYHEDMRLIPPLSCGRRVGSEICARTFSRLHHQGEARVDAVCGFLCFLCRCHRCALETVEFRGLSAPDLWCREECFIEDERLISCGKNNAKKGVGPSERWANH